jgi:hypothetical protein
VLPRESELLLLPLLEQPLCNTTLNLQQSLATELVMLNILQLLAAVAAADLPVLPLNAPPFCLLLLLPLRLSFQLQAPIEPAGLLLLPAVIPHRAN